MNENKQLGGALCAAGGNPTVAEAAAPAEGKKKYVPPTMQVIPLSTQMLAGSAPSVRIPGWCMARSNDFTSDFTPAPLIAEFARRVPVYDPNGIADFMEDLDAGRIVLPPSDIRVPYTHIYPETIAFLREHPERVEVVRYSASVLSDAGYEHWVSADIMLYLHGDDSNCPTMIDISAFNGWEAGCSEPYETPYWWRCH